MKKSLLLLSVAALFAAPAVVFATEPVAEFDTELFDNPDASMKADDKNGPGVDGEAPGANTYIEDIENKEITPRPDGKIAVVETRIGADGKPVDTVIFATREEGTNKADRAVDPAAPKAEEAAKPAANTVKAAATKTAAKALPKTSAAK